MRPRRPPRSDAPLIYGRNAVLEAARAGRLRRALVAQGVGEDPRLTELAELVAVEKVGEAAIAELVEGRHQGVVGELAPRRTLALRELLDRSPSLIVALDGIQDPQNLGAILRSAEAAGADGVVLPQHRSAPLSPAAAKASSGASELLDVCLVPGLASAIPEIERAGLWCVALDPSGDRLPWEIDLTAPVCVVVGAEGQGVHRLVRERCDFRVRLPMAGRIASLNASAAAAVLLFEAVRQRTQAVPGPEVVG